jgi:hypothetical protein
MENKCIGYINMKKVTPFGPGTHPTLLLDDTKADEVYKKLMAGEEVEIESKGKKLGIRAGTAWAIELEDFNESE